MFFLDDLLEDFSLGLVLVKPYHHHGLPHDHPGQRADRPGGNKRFKQEFLNFNPDLHDTPSYYWQFRNQQHTLYTLDQLHQSQEVRPINQMGGTFKHNVIFS